MNIKVLHIINSLVVGGAEKILVDTILHLKKTNPEIEHYVITLTSEGKYVADIENETTYISLNFTIFNFISVINKIRNIIKKEAINIVHAHLFESSIISRMATPKGVKLINTYHSAYNKPDSSEFSRKRLLVDRLTVNRTDAVIFVSNTLKEINTQKLNIKSKIIVIPNFCNSEFVYNYNFNAKTELRLIMVGNLIQIKNQIMAIKAIKYLNKINIYLDIYGEGNLRSSFEDFILKNGLNVKLKGIHKITSELLTKYDAFLMTSTNEGMPISLIESIVSGLPSILNDLPELRETAGNSAIYFKRNSLDDLINKINELYLNKNRLIELSEKCKINGQQYDIDNYINKLLAVYK